MCFSIAIYKQSLNRFPSFYVRIYFSFTLRVVNSENICTCICSKVVFLYHSNNCEWKCMHVQIRDKCLMLLSWCLMEWVSSLNVHFHRISFVPTLNLLAWLSLFNQLCIYIHNVLQCKVYMILIIILCIRIKITNKGMYNII